MLRANYTAEDQKTFEQLRYSYPDERIMRRFEILWLHTGNILPQLPTRCHDGRYEEKRVLQYKHIGLGEILLAG